MTTRAAAVLALATLGAIALTLPAAIASGGGAVKIRYVGNVAQEWAALGVCVGAPDPTSEYALGCGSPLVAGRVTITLEDVANGPQRFLWNAHGDGPSCARGEAIGTVSFDVPEGCPFVLVYLHASAVAGMGEFSWTG